MQTFLLILNRMYNYKNKAYKYNGYIFTKILRYGIMNM